MSEPNFSDGLPDYEDELRRDWSLRDSQYADFPPLPDPEDGADVIEQDHAEQDEPAHTARLRKGVEQVTVRAFVGAKLLTFTFPRVALGEGAEMMGCVREVPVGWRDMASAEAFETCFERHVQGYERLGWVRG